jgi:hypothetical protein
MERKSHYLKPDAGKGYHILANGQLLDLVHQVRQLPGDERVQQKIGLDSQKLQKSGLVTAISKPVRISTVEQDKAPTRCCETTWLLREWRVHFQESEDN